MMPWMTTSGYLVALCCDIEVPCVVPWSEEEIAARELQEEMQRNVEEAQERVWESEENLCRELEESMYSLEREIGRPNNSSTKIWQMMQGNSAKSENLESDFTEILEKTRLLGWNENTKSIRVRAEKEEDESSQSWSGSCLGRLFLN